MSKKHSFIFTIMLISVAILLLSTMSRADQNANQARQLQQQGDILPLEQIIELAVAVKQGQILETDLERDDGRYVYELEILDSRGQVWEIELDAQTGELLELENED